MERVTAHGAVLHEPLQRTAVFLRLSSFLHNAQLSEFFVIPANAAIQNAVIVRPMSLT